MGKSDTGAATAGAAPVWRPAWPVPEGVLALATERGADGGQFGGFNLAMHVGDDPARVASHRAALQRSCGGLPIQWLEQVHGTTLLRVDNANAVDRVARATPRADGSYTDRVGVALAVLTADCLPVLLCDDRGREIAAVHAGWRGLAAGVLNEAVTGFQAAPDRLLAWLGPAISARHYEVGAPVRAAFLRSLAFSAVRGQVSAAFQPSARPGHCYCDLNALARLCLRGLGVSRIYGGDVCTFRQAQRFYSYRREGVCGRMAAMIALT